MRDQYLMRQITDFITEFRMVEERQVLKFFSDLGKEDAKYALKRLIDAHIVHRIKDSTRLATDRVNNIFVYDTVIDALDVMVELTSREVSWYSLRDVPFDLEFCVNNMTMITVTTFTKENWLNRYEQTKRLRHVNLPEGEEDPRKHIAVVSDLTLIEKIEPLGFSLFVRIADKQTGELEKYGYTDGL